MVDTATCEWQVVQQGDGAKLPRRRRLAAARGAGTRLLFFGGWDGTHTCADLLEIDTSGWLRLDASQPPTAAGGLDARSKRPSGGAGGGGANSGAGGALALAG